MPLADATWIEPALFYLFAGLTVGSALGIVLSRNIVRTAVLLLFTLLGAAGLYFLLAAEFLAVVQLVVYAGGTLILIVFGVMLTSKSPYARYGARPLETAVALLAGLAALVGLLLAILSARFDSVPLQAETYPVAALGKALLGSYLVPFELVSVLLLAVMIGAAYLARRRRDPEDEVAES